MGSQTTKELLDIATSHASGEEAVGAIFDHLGARRSGMRTLREGTSNRSSKKKNK
jgi:hypothetical protein